jgi:hypothetical protein
MKYLAILGAAVLLIVVAWVFFGGHPSEPPVPKAAPAPGTSNIPLESMSPSERKDLQAVSHAALHLARVSSNRPQARECVDYLNTWCDQLEDASWNAATSSILLAWERLRVFPEVGDVLPKLEQKMVARFIKSGSGEALEGLVRISTQSNRVGERVLSALSDLAAAPIATFRGSRQSLLISAAVRAKELGRAKEFAERTTFTSDAAQAEKDVHALLRRTVELAAGASSGPADMAAVIGQWKAGQGDAVAKDAATHETIRNVLELIGVSTVRSEANSPEGGKLAGLLKASSAQPDAPAYWEKVASLIAQDPIESASGRTALLRPLLRAYSGSYQASTFESEIWVDLAQRDATQKKREAFQKAQSIEWLKYALASARNDDQRFTVIQKLKGAYSGLREFAAGRQALTEAGATLGDPAKKAAVEGLVKDLDREEAADRKRVEEATRTIERDRLLGQLAYMKERLEVAKKAGSPATDISSIEAVVKDLEVKCSAVK